MDDKLKNIDLKSILIVESIEDEVNRFIDVVHKNCDAKVTAFTNSVEAVLWLQTNFADIIILEEDLKPMGVEETTQYIQNELQTSISVFISTKDAGQELEEHYLLKPFTYESLQKLCKVKMDCDPASSHYSLNYLKEVSDGNMEFVSSSIEIFRSSVSQQINELEDASQRQDHKRIGEIAHHIKPSFEMLLNHEAAGICNNLIYKLDPQQAEAQIRDLKSIFEKIKKELDSDNSLKKS